MKTTIQIQNLKCGGCEVTIYHKLSTHTAIKNLFVNVDESTLTFEYSIDEDLETVKETLLKIGYPVVGDENKLITQAKSYVSCAIGRVKK